MITEELRCHFPVVDQVLYLDHGSMSPLPTPVLQAVEGFQRHRHLYGRDFSTWWEQAEGVRARLAGLMGAESDEVAFTGSTSQAINVVAAGLDWQPGENVILNDLEFPANIYPWLNLRSRGVEIRMLHGEGNQLTPEQIEAAMDSRTRLLAISHVQASNGLRSDLQALGALCARRSVLFAVDAIQSLGAFEVDVNRYGIDFLFGATFKWLLAPDGLGFLYVRGKRLPLLGNANLGWAGMRNRNNFAAYQVDLPEAARRFELGNLNFSALYGLGAALELIGRTGVDRIAARITELVTDLYDRLSEIEGVIHRSPAAPERRGGLLTFDIPEREALFRALGERQIISALRPNGIRVSPHAYLRESDLDRFVEATAEHVRRHRR